MSIGQSMMFNDSNVTFDQIKLPQPLDTSSYPGRIDRLLIDKHCIDHTGHLDQLLPAVAGKRETSQAATASTFSRRTSVTIRSEAARMAEPAAEPPRSS